MGLDMYLSAERSLYPDYKDRAKVDLPEVKKIRKMFPEMFKTGNLDYVRLQFEAGYWRKANHIHKWFVENVQGGVDNCGKYYTSREDLKKLLAICLELVSKTKLKKGKISTGYTFDKKGNKKYSYEDGEIVDKPKIAHGLLPTEGGFFFGGTNYDQWYYEDTKETIKIIEKCLKLPEEWNFEYHSSW